MPGIFPPEPCGIDNRDEILTHLGKLRGQGGAPVGVANWEIARYVAGQHPANAHNFVNGLLHNQKNFIVHLTDGRDTCECEKAGYDTGGKVDIRGSSATPAVTRPNTGNHRFIQAYNAGLKSEEALKYLDPDLDGSKGNIFMIGVDLDAVDKEKTNHVAWLASGARLTGRDPSLMFPAFFADDPDQLVKAFRDILSLIGVPETEVTLGTPVVGSVKELIPEIPGLLVKDIRTSLIRPSETGDVHADMSLRLSPIFEWMTSLSDGNLNACFLMAISKVLSASIVDRFRSNSTQGMVAIVIRCNETPKTARKATKP
jgi:hypothetical protein